MEMQVVQAGSNSRETVLDGSEDIAQTMTTNTSDDIPFEDIVLLQLFKDNLLNKSSNSTTGSDRVSSDDSEFSDLESVISSQETNKEYEKLSFSQSFFSPPGTSGLNPSSLPGPDQLQPVYRNVGGYQDSVHSEQPRPCLGQQSSGRRLGKDEKLAKEANLPFSVKTLVSLPMDEFNDMLSKKELTEDQLNVCRDIRRRGKNKVAAQNCRQRKLEQIEELQVKLKRAVDRRDRVKHEHGRLLRNYTEEAGKLKLLTESVLNYYNKDNLNFTLQVLGEEVAILPKTEVKEETLPLANSMDNHNQYLNFNQLQTNFSNNPQQSNPNNYYNPYTNHQFNGGCQPNSTQQLRHYNYF